jgi:hypothetical protein
MIYRFRKVIPELYRGSAPSVKDVIALKYYLDINKIISLDKESGEKISKICCVLNIQHIKLYLDFTKKSFLNLFQYNLKDLLTKNGPVFVHCYHGKDRTGLLIALFQRKYLNLPYKKVIEDAKLIGLGVGLSKSITNLYDKLIKNCKPCADINNADIVSNQREYIGDNRGSYLDEGRQGSFAPFLSDTWRHPVDLVYNYINHQSPTRDNYYEYKSIKQHSQQTDVVPIVGLYNNDAGMRGIGPSENYGGFIYD